MFNFFYSLFLDMGSVISTLEEMRKNKSFIFDDNIVKVVVLMGPEPILSEDEEFHHIHTEPPSIKRKLPEDTDSSQFMNNSEPGTSSAGPSQKKCKVIFSEIETFCLLDIYDEVKDDFKKNYKRHSQVWDKVGLKMSENGFNKDGTKCNNRFTNLKRKYFELKRNIKSGDQKPDWKYFDIYNRIFGTRPMAVPEALCDLMDPVTVESLMVNEEEEDVL